MKLQLISRNKGLILDDDIHELKAHTLAGKINVLNNHAPLLTAITPAQSIELHYTDKPCIQYQLDNAFLEILEGNNAVIIADNITLITNTDNIK